MDQVERLKILIRQRDSEITKWSKAASYNRTLEELTEILKKIQDEISNG